MVDSTGTDFSDWIWAFSLDDFDIPYDQWAAGQTITIDSNIKMNELVIDAVGKEPFLQGPNAPKFIVSSDLPADGDDWNGTYTQSPVNTVIENASGTQTADFTGKEIYTEEYWEFNATGPDGITHPYWIAKMTDGQGNDMLISNYSMEPGSTISLVGLDETPSFRTPDTTDFDSIFDGSGVINADGTSSNSAFFPRIDRASAPNSPAETTWDIDGIDGTSQILVYDARDITLNVIGGNPVGNQGTFSFAAGGNTGILTTPDQDDYIGDGSAGYGNDFQNEFDQFAKLEFGDGTVIDGAYYQLEGAFSLIHPDNLDADPNNDDPAKNIAVAQLNFNRTDTQPLAWVATGKIDEGVTYTIEYGDGSPGFNNGNLTDEQELTFQYTELVCYTQGTMIEASDGPVAVEDLRVGDMIKTKDNGLVPVRWVDYSTATPEMMEEDSSRCPVKISAGALGNNMPKQDLYVSRQHRMLIDSDIAEQAFGQREVFAKAKDLAGIVPGVELVNENREVRYYHILLDQHQVIYANGTPSESFYPGVNAIHEFNKKMRQEIIAAVPQTATIPQGGYPLAREHPQGKRMRECLMTHVAQNAALVDPLPMHKAVFKRVTKLISNALQSKPAAWIAQQVR